MIRGVRDKYWFKCNNHASIVTLEGNMNYKKRVMLFLFQDLIVIYVAVALSFLLLFQGDIPNEYVDDLYFTFLLLWFSNSTLFFINKIYKRIWQFASISELLIIFKATTVAHVLTIILYLLLSTYLLNFHIPISIFLMSWLLIFFGVCSSRFIWRITYNHKWYKEIQPHHKNALIIGAGSAGAMIARALKNDLQTPLYPVAFIDDDPDKNNLQIYDIPIVGEVSDISNIVKKFNIHIIVIAMPSAPRKRVAELISICKNIGVKVQIIPHLSDLVSGKVTTSTLRDVDVEDLLYREQVIVDIEKISGYLSRKTVLITGAGGSIGSELCRQICTFNPKVLLILGHGENSIYLIENELNEKFPNVSIIPIIADIKDRSAIENVFTSYSPNVIFHAAAHKHVPLMERNPIEAVKNNVFGTKIVAECADKFKAEHFVLISSDKSVNPTSVMGATKRMGEIITQQLVSNSSTKFVAVRFGNVIGSRGSVIPLFLKQIKRGGPVTVTHPDMVRYFMTIPEAVQLVFQAGALAKGGEIFILDMKDPVNISRLAKDLIRLSGLTPGEDIKIEYTGIRPGEKLYEEVLTDEEGTSATKHDRIFVAKPPSKDVQGTMNKLTQLEALIFSDEEQVDSGTIRKLIKEMVPTYQPKKE
jgi:FlaA1/EpsC-like NDP-sugar epimerase